MTAEIITLRRAKPASDAAMKAAHDVFLAALRLYQAAPTAERWEAMHEARGIFLASWGADPESPYVA